MTPSPDPPRSPSGPCLLAAPPLTRAEDAAEGEEILNELPTPAGVLLWQALRDLMGWMETPAAHRPALFDAGAEATRLDEIRAAGVDPQVWPPLLTLANLAPRPRRVDTARLAHACRRLATWAEEHGAPGTRLAFTQATALVQPNDPELALHTARQARDLAQYARAETWFRTAIKLARGRDWTAYVWGYVGLGILYRRLGNHPAALVVAQRALRTARRHRLREMEGYVLHDLFVCTSEGRDLQQAYDYAREALAAYGPNHPRIPALMQDVACFWCDLGHFARAWPVLHASVAHAPDPNERAIYAANSVRAAGGMGDRVIYQQARNHALSLISKARNEEHLSAAYISLSRGAASMGEWTRAEDAANRALEVASRRGEAQLRFVAEAELRAARAGHMALACTTTAEEANTSSAAGRLAELFLYTLEPG